MHKINFVKATLIRLQKGNHLLNVRAGNMSVFVDEPNHFVNWLHENHPQFSATSFVSRKIFGEYIQSTFTDLIINCTGSESNYSKIKSTLVQYLVNSEFIAPDALKYGINAKKDGQISKNVYALGLTLKGILWESVAVPEIRVQAHVLASKIICD